MNTSELTLSKENVVCIEEWVYEKVKKSDVNINIPQSPIFYQEYNYSTIIGLFPQFANWSDNHVWEIQIVKITEKAIQRTMIRTNPNELSDLVSRSHLKNKSPEDYLKDKVVFWLKNFYGDDLTTKEVFLQKYQKVQDSIFELVGVE